MSVSEREREEEEGMNGVRLVASWALWADGARDSLRTTLMEKGQLVHVRDARQVPGGTSLFFQPATRCGWRCLSLDLGSPFCHVTDG